MHTPSFGCRRHLLIAAAVFVTAVVATACSMTSSPESPVAAVQIPEAIPVATQAPAVLFSTKEAARESTTGPRCGEPEPDLAEFALSTTGDFDGDGRIDTLYLRSGDPAAELGRPRADLAPARVAVTFGDGGFATGSLATPGASEAEDIRQVDNIVAQFRPAGLDHDAVIIDEPTLRGAYAGRLAIIHIEDCTPQIIGWVSTGASVGNQLGWCIASNEDGDILRSFQSQSNELQQFGAVEDRHLVWDGSELAELWPPVPTLEPLCGPTLLPLVDLGTDNQSAGVLSGDHGLSLQWIGGNSSAWGTVRFIAIGDDQYRVVGRQSDDEGSWVQVAGTMSQVSDLELRFDGVIETSIAYVNNGEPCIRSGSQTFLSTQGRQYWRLQDLLNCDDIHTDYVDIYF